MQPITRDDDPGGRRRPGHDAPVQPDAGTRRHKEDLRGGEGLQGGDEGLHRGEEDLSRAVAIVGMGCVLPGGRNVPEFWQTVKNGVDCIREVPKERWDPEVFYDENGADDKSYTKIGGFITDFEFEPIAFRIPPKTAQALDPLQQMTLVATREAFLDAGFLDERLKDARAFDRDRTAVVLGNSMGGEVQRKYTRRVSWPLMERQLRQALDEAGIPAAQKDRIVADYQEKWLSLLPPITEDSMPGELSNVVSGRVANVFDLRGKNHTTDAACASSFAAFDMAVKSLLEGECDLVVTGGADRSMDIDTFVKFCKIGALSANGSTPFDARADGFVMGEGCAVFLVKRLADAVRDGDKIHAVIRGLGASSDGRGKGITAPNKRGQVLAVQRGLEASGVPPGSIQYMEAHGTSTRVGDVVEVEALSEALAPAGPAPGSIALGSLKSQIGHLKSAAGAASLLKTVLAFKHQTLPPSINFETPNPNIDWEHVPFRVVKEAEPWPEGPAGVPRRAGISSFGFGGTNFHVVLEEYMPEHHDRAAKAPQTDRLPTASQPASHENPGAHASPCLGQGSPPVPMDREQMKKILSERAHLEAEALVLGAATKQGLVEQIKKVKDGFPDSSFLQTGEGPRMKDLVYAYNIEGVKAHERVAMVASSPEDAREKAEFALSCLEDERRMRMANVKGVFFGNGAPRGKVAFLFPGQGSQYAEMLLDLHEKFAIVRDTFREADDILEPFLGTRLTGLVFPPHDRGDQEARKQALKQAEEALKRTEICQPAVLTVDIALWRLLRSVGIEPDAVAGHSLGEYAALVASGILRFEDALVAVSARGKEMANVDVPDHGKMASITADPQTIQTVLDQIDDYVIMANKNCPSMTVIAGSSSGVDKAVKAFQQQGVQAFFIPVSAAFHSKIVAPASGPLSRLLRRLSIRRPHTPVYANVTGERYQEHEDPDAFLEYTVGLLSEQIAAPVEWTKTIENMHQEGVRYFLEVGPKKALTAFVQDILKGKEFKAAATNHPKKGGVYHFNETYALVSAEGFIPKVKHPEATAHYTPVHLDPLGRLAAAGPPPQAQKRTLEQVAAVSRASSTQAGNGAGSSNASQEGLAQVVSTPELRRLAREEGFLAYARSQAPVVSAMLRAGWRSNQHTGTGTHGADEGLDESQGREGLPPGFQYDTQDIVVSGASVGLPGRDRSLFDDSNAESILAGENRIDQLTPEERAWMTDKNIVRLKKSGDGSAEFEPIDEESKVIKLAGVPGRVDIVEDFGVDRKFQEALDITSELAIGASIDALRDAGIPLVRDYQRTSTGSHLPGDWVLPKDLQDDTGVIFASAWPGYNNLVEEITRFLTNKHKGQDREVIEGMLQRIAQVVPDATLRQQLVDWIRRETASLTSLSESEVYGFNRRFVFRILAMGHAQVAQHLKAKGPNTQVNAACSSTTLAVSIAEDWIRTGRARRVIVVGADAPTIAPLFEWLSAGFLAAGAATTKGEVEEAAIPFDRRRHGMINGCGAVGLIVEKREDVKARGMDGLVRILASQVANSAYHASRLDVDHVAEQMEKVVALAEERYGIDRSSLAKDLVFMSHETYTPARGGSASAEIKSLRRAFGDHANEVLVTNTKGFTGHPHGASIEDAIAVKMLQLGRVPPIPNLKERDPELGDLNLSTGGETDRKYTLRLAAGFGSQITLWIGECLTRGTDRVRDEAAHKAWLQQVSGQDAPRLEVVKRRLRVVDQGPPPRAPRAQSMPEKASPEPVPAPAPSVAPPTPRPTPPTPTPAQDAPAPEPSPTPMATSPSASPAATPAAAPAGDTPQSGAPAQGTTGDVDKEAILRDVIEMVVEQTGYPQDMLEPDLDLEADLGIDTVKQAELFGLLREKYHLPQEEGVQIKDYPTLSLIADYITSRLSGDASTAPPEPGPAHLDETPSMGGMDEADQASGPEPAPAVAEHTAPELAQSPVASVDREEALKQLVELVAEQTGYPMDMLEPELDLEADLGIDTVKQAELFGLVREKYGLPQEEGIQIKDYPTLSHIADYIVSRSQGAATTGNDPVPSTQPPVPATTSQSPSAQPQSPARPEAATASPDRASPSARVGQDRAPTPATSAPKELPGLDDLEDGAPSFSLARPGPGPAKKTTPAPAAPPAKTSTGAPVSPELGLSDGAPSVPAAPQEQARQQPGTPRSSPDAQEQGANRRMTSTVAPPAAEPTGDAEAPAASAEAPAGDPEAVAHAKDHTKVVERVTLLVAEQTGYPEDMLEPDLDLEADLGIDTVKQAELFGIVRELYGLPLPEGLKIADYPTISRVADFVVETAGTASAPPSERPEGPQGPPEGPGGMGAQDMGSEETGDATADVASTRASAAPAAAPQVQEEGPQKGPNAQPVDGVDAAAGKRAQEGASPTASGVASVETIRRVPVPVDAPIESPGTRDPAINGVLLITQDRMGWAERFVERFTQQGITVALVGHTQPHDSVPGYFLPADLSDPDSVEQTVALVHERLGPVGGIVHLAGLQDEKGPTDPAGFRERAREAVRSLYLFARSANEDLVARKGAPVLAVTRMGGTFGLPEADGMRPMFASIDPVQGGVTGLTKALAKELPDCFVRSIDLGVEVGPQDAVRLAWQEITSETTRTEVGWPELDRRVEMLVRPRETTHAEAQPCLPGDHIVASGGAQGVTAECLVGLVERVGRERAPSLTLIGRTPLPSGIVDLARLTDSELEERKKELLARMREQHERVTPVMLEREWSRTTKALEVHRNLGRLRALGARVEYLTADIQDPRSVEAALSKARQLGGPITGLLHGAGLEVSKQLADKDPEQFDRVFETKALGMFNLLWAVRDDPLRQVCVFSSVAGRFGNLGQVDYSAGNDLAVRLVVDVDRLPDVRGFAIDWSAWADVGMATRGGIMQVMEAAGVTPVAVKEGVGLFIEEWLTGDVHPEVVIAGGLGQIDADRQVVEEPLAPVTPRVEVDGTDSMPLVDAFMSHVPHRYAVATRNLRLDRDLYLEDHRVDSVAYLPGVFGVEMFAQAAEVLLTREEREAGCTFIAADNVEYRLPVKLLRDCPVDVRVIVERRTPVPQAVPIEEVESDGSDAEFLGGNPEPKAPVAPVRVACRLESDFVSPEGKVLGDARVHFLGELTLGVPEPHPVTKDLPATPGGGEVLFDRSDVYDHFFHGPTFQVLDSVARLEGRNVAAVARFEHDGLFADVPRPGFRSAPLLREAMFQACGFWAMAQKGVMALPAGIRSVRHYTQPAEAPPGTSLVVVARHEREVDDAHSEYTVEAYTPEGLLVDRMEGFRMIRTGNHRIESRKGPDSLGDEGAPGAPAPAPESGSTDKEVPGSRYEVAEEEDDWELAVRDPQGREAAVSLVCVGGQEGVRVDVAALARVLDDPRFTARWFSRAERRRLEGMRVDKRRIEHAAGLLAAKNALSRRFKQAGCSVAPGDVQVDPDPQTRAPVWSVPGVPGLPRVELSVSHSGPHAVAVTSPGDDGNLGIGVDVESVAPRDPALWPVVFTPEEIEWLQSDEAGLARRVALLWTVKEAVVKGLKTGLAVDLRDVRVHWRPDGSPVVDLPGGLLERAPGLAKTGGAVKVDVSASTFSPGHVAAFARLTRGL